MARGEEQQPLLSHGEPRQHDPSFKGVVHENRKFRDIPFAFLFLVTFAAMIAVSFVGFSKGDPSLLIKSSELSDKAESKVEYWFQDAVAQLKEDRFILLGVIALACCLSFIWIFLLKKFTKLFI
jgi:hypothetical protein